MKIINMKTTLQTQAAQAEPMNLPWTYIRGKTLIHIESSMDASPSGDPVCSIPLSKEDRAAFIVRVCNSHQALVDALKDAKAMLDKLGSFDGMQPVGKTTRYSRICAALKQAQE